MAIQRLLDSQCEYSCPANSRRASPPPHLPRVVFSSTAALLNTSALRGTLRLDRISFRSILACSNLRLSIIWASTST
jgi:hypothetical protein